MTYFMTLAKALTLVVASAADGAPATAATIHVGDEALCPDQGELSDEEYDCRVRAVVAGPGGQYIVVLGRVR